MNRLEGAEEVAAIVLRARRGHRTTFTAIAGAGLACALVTGFAAPTEPVVYRVAPVTNPDLAPACAVDVVLAVDASVTAGTHGEVVRSALTRFVSVLADKNVRAAIVPYAGTATTPVGLEPVTAPSARPDGRHGAALASYTFRPGRDWQDALRTTRSLLSRARPGATRLAVFVSDAAPSEYTDAAGQTVRNVGRRDVAAVDAATEQANALRVNGIHVLAVGTGIPLDPSADQLYRDALTRVSGPDAGRYEASTTDQLLEPDPTRLGASLAEVARQITDVQGCAYLSLAPSRHVLPYGARKKVTFVASLATPRAQSGRVPVELRARRPGQAWQVVATAVTDAQGVARFSLRPKATRDYQVTFSGTTGLTAVASDVTRVSVVPRVKLEAIRGKRLGRKAQVVRWRGSVAPHRGRWTVLLEKRDGSTWRTVDKLLTKRGAYQFKRVVTRKGVWRVVIAPHGAYGSAQSHTVTVSLGRPSSRC